MNDNSNPNQRTDSSVELASHDEIVLLAEGELSLVDKEQLLQKIEATSDWKRVTIALLQTQALQASFASVPTHLEMDHAQQKSVPQSNKKEPNQKSLSVWKLAICLGLVFVLGGWVGRWTGNPDQIADAKGHEENRERIDSQPKATGDPRILTQVYQAVDSLGVKDSELIAFVNVEHESQRKVFPLIRSPQLAKQIQFTDQPDLPENVESHMRKSGWQVQSTKQFVSIHLPNGKSKVFPIGMLNYKFVGNPVF